MFTGSSVRCVLEILERRLFLSVVQTAGAPDPAFGAYGAVLTRLSARPEYSDDAAGVLVQSDGKILVVGTANVPHSAVKDQSQAALVRYDSNGTLDTTFGPKSDGIVLESLFPHLPCGLSGVTQLPNGDLIALGFTATKDTPKGYQNDIALAEFDTNGLPITAFGTDGVQTISFGSLNSFASIFNVQSDGDILIGGLTTMGAGVTQLAIRKLTPQGAVIPGSTMSINVTPPRRHGAGGQEIPDTVSVLPDGKFLVAGFANKGGTSLLPRGSIFLSRYTAAGAVDPTFHDGTPELLPHIGKYLNSIVGLQVGAPDPSDPTDDILTIIESDQVAAYDYDISTFSISGDGAVQFDNQAPCPDEVKVAASAFESDGKILIAGTSQKDIQGKNERHFVLARYNPDLSLDGTFGTAGITASVVTRGTAAAGIALTDGKIVLSGTSYSTQYKGLVFSVQEFDNDVTE